MSVGVGVPEAAGQRSNSMDVAIVAGAIALALVAALAAQMGLNRAQPIVGGVVILGLAYVFSTNRRAIHLPTVAWGLALQMLFALIVLKTASGSACSRPLEIGLPSSLSFAFVGAEFVFGPLGNSAQWRQITQALGPGRGGPAGCVPSGADHYFCRSAVCHPLLLRHHADRRPGLRVADAPRHAASGAESLNVAASIFMGQTEAPLTIRPYLPEMTQSELMTVMTSGMAHISGGIMAAYILFGVEAKHLLTAVIMTAPGTIMMAKMFVPETEIPKTMGSVRLEVPKTDVNVIDAAARGTSEGLHLALNVLAMLISFIALVALVNALLGFAHLSLQQIFGWVFAPVAWSMGVPWRDAPAIGNLLGTRMVLNEFIAYSQLGPMKEMLDPKSFTIATFALCGFANFGSIGIQIGGIGALAPNRRHDLARLGVRAMFAGTLANFMTATIAGFLL